MNLKKFNLLIILILLAMPAQSEESDILKKNNKYNIFLGTFDTIDKEGDDKTSLFGIEHNNTNLVRETILGRFLCTSRFSQRQLQILSQSKVLVIFKFWCFKLGGRVLRTPSQTESSGAWES